MVGHGTDFLLCSCLQAKKPNGGKGGRPVWTPPSEMMSKCSLVSLAACTGQGQSTDQRLWLMVAAAMGGLTEKVDGSGSSLSQQHALKLQTLAMINKLSLLSQTDSSKVGGST